MNSFVDPNAPTITLASIEQFAYILAFFLVASLLYVNRHRLKENPKKLMLGILIIAVIQRLISGFYYYFFLDYTIVESLPLHICRLVCYFIILQFFIKKDVLDQMIFYWGIFAYASFIYPVGISSPFHMLGISFFILHTLIILYPMLRHLVTVFYPTVKGAIVSSVFFMIYITLMHLLNKSIGSNYFYTIDRPFWHDMPELTYFLVNLIGVCSGFILVGLVLQVLRVRRK